MPSTPSTWTAAAAMLSAAPPITTGSEEIRPKEGNKKSQIFSLLGGQYRWCQLPELAHVRHRPPRQYRNGQAYYRLHSVLLSYTALGSCARRRATWRSRARSIHVFSLSLSLSTRAREYCTHAPASPTHTPAPSTRTLASSTPLRDSAARFSYSHAGGRVVFTDSSLLSPGTPRFALPDSTSSGTS